MERAAAGRAGLTRRAVLAGFMSSLAVPALAAEHPSLGFMRKAAKDLLNAHRQGTAASFKRVIQRHADVTGIADYSLGQYRPKLPSAQKERYYGGVTTFMARYFADQSREYPVAKYEIGAATITSEDDIEIASKVFLLSGQTYTVNWKVGWRGGRYKLLDAKVLGFSLVYLQRGIFTSYIGKRNGDVGELVTALNR